MVASGSARSCGRRRARRFGRRVARHAHGGRVGAGGRLRAARHRRLGGRPLREHRLGALGAGRRHRRRRRQRIAQRQRRDLALRRGAEGGAQRAHVLRPVVRRDREAVAQRGHELRRPRAHDRVERRGGRVGQSARHVASALQGIGRRLAGREAEQRRRERVDVGPRPELAAGLEILLGAKRVARCERRRAAARGGAERAAHEMRAAERRRAVAADRDRGRANVEMQQPGLVDRVGAGEQRGHDLVHLVGRERLAGPQQPVERAPLGRLHREIDGAVRREAVEQRQHVGVAKRGEVGGQRLDLGDAGREQRAEIGVARFDREWTRAVAAPARDAGRQELQHRRAPRRRRVVRAIRRTVRPALGDRLLDAIAPDHGAGRKEEVGGHGAADPYAEAGLYDVTGPAWLGAAAEKMPARGARPAVLKSEASPVLLGREIRREVSPWREAAPAAPCATGSRAGRCS
ncbi:MAG: hypothetical protein U1F37_12150 [Alphaproteobacteria bacterium]